MRVAFDIHGTIDSDSKLLDFVKMISVMDSFEVFIISGPPGNQIDNEIKALGLDLDNMTVISVVDYLQNLNIPMWKDENGWWCDPDTWWKSKGMICSDYKIDILFDDKIEYANAMPSETRFILWKGEINEKIN